MSFNQNMRWKKFDQAARYLEPQQQADFLNRYMEREQDLFIQLMEVRTVSKFEHHQAAFANVMVITESYLLPSTIIKKLTQIQKWKKLEDGHWILVELSQDLLSKP